MCEGCYQKYGAPKIITAQTIAAAVLVAKVYEFSSTGGNMHIYVDDWNLNDEDFAGTELQISFNNASSEQLAIERACYAVFRVMSVPQRASALALYDGYVLADVGE